MCIWTHRVSDKRSFLQFSFFLRIFSPVRRHKIKIPPVGQYGDVDVSIFPKLLFLNLTSTTPPDSSKIVVFPNYWTLCLYRRSPLSPSLTCFFLGRDVMNGIWVNVMIRLLASAVINASLWQRSDTADRGGASGCK